ncbi:MAG TPA: hypothetical protein PLU35_11740 [Phycisphaerales bacterium]|nr:hypothetical protein [Phycisphaerales bacterium]
MEYVVIGGMAEVLHGGMRPTYDVDVCYRRTPENLHRLEAALGEVHPALRGAPPGLPFRADARTLEAGNNFTFDTDIGPLDLLGWVEPIGDFDRVNGESVDLRFGESTIRVLSVDGLIRIKQHVNRPKDQASLAELLAIKREREGGAA